MPIRLLVLVLILLIPMVPTFWAIQDIPNREFAERKKKITWFLLVSVLPFIGAMLYILFVRKHTKPLEDSQRSIL